MSRSAPRLMVLLSDRITEWIEKGEVVDRYYNPGEVFSRVDLVLTNDDRPDPATVQRLVGRAEVHVWNVPTPERFFYWSLGMRPRLVRLWSRRVVQLARRLEPDVVRCHGADVNGIAASEVGRALGTPTAISLHTNPDEADRGQASSWRERLVVRAMASMQREGLRDADLVLPVYQAIVPYLERLGVTRYDVAYNVVGGGRLRPKEDYALHEPVRAISVGRLIEAKNPENLVRAVGELEGVELLIVGDGPLRGRLEAIASDRVRFAGSLPNEEVCGLLSEHDLFATRSAPWEISKSVIEALLTGLPVVHNEAREIHVPELDGGICRMVEDSVEGYRAALAELIADDAGRERLGRHGRQAAEARWSPERTEAHYADIYRRLLAQSARIPSPA